MDDVGKKSQWQGRINLTFPSVLAGMLIVDQI